MRSELTREARAFLAEKQQAGATAGQLAALQLICGIDLFDALASGKEGIRAVLIRLSRAIERERLKGARGHWSYDLNRHIALKQAHDRLSAVLAGDGAAGDGATGGRQSRGSRRAAGRPLEPGGVPRRHFQGEPGRRSTGAPRDQPPGEPRLSSKCKRRPKAPSQP